MLKIYAIFSLFFALNLQAATWEMPEFMISTWGGPEVEDNDAKVKALKKAGLNTVMWNVDNLDVLRKYGLKALVEDATPEKAACLKGDSVVWGYHLVDEPETDMFTELEGQVAEIILKSGDGELLKITNK